MDVSQVGGTLYDVNRVAESDGSQKVERTEQSARDGGERESGGQSSVRSDPGPSAGQNVDISV